ncbi:MAG TPA: ribosome-associated translation inhibitor RaiA [Candidatus Saccharimonadales bacterium]|nr:ribosome-associated translation inhibitor RaiA [Candidatus Saccharimonadales bacterium]
MIKLQITGRHYDLDEKIVAYVEKKLGGLDKYLPRNTRIGLSGKAILELDESHNQDQQCICEAHFEVKGERLHARDAAINMYAAIDICEQKLKSQVLTYKSKHQPAKNRRQQLLTKVFVRDPFSNETGE